MIMLLRQVIQTLYVTFCRAMLSFFKNKNQMAWKKNQGRDLLFKKFIEKIGMKIMISR